jgi:multidrug efflux system outer membrane protein
VWSTAPSLNLPIFSGGANTANLAYSKAQRDSYVAAYELAVQTAFKEVANALAVRGTMQEQFDSQSALVDAASVSFRLHRSGRGEYLQDIPLGRLSLTL